MDEKDRPGGLTALAVINFILAALSLLGIFGPFITRILISNIPMDSMTDAQVAQLTAIQNMSGLTLAVITCVSAVRFLLLLLSGIGYLKQKKVMGRVLGSCYGALGIIYVFSSTTIFSQVLGGGFGVMSVISLIYPVLTLILLNFIYKDDLIY